MYGTLEERRLRSSGRSCCNLETSSMIWSSEIREVPEDDCLDLLLDIFLEPSWNEQRWDDNVRCCVVLLRESKRRE
nr:hypothetical protein Iba_chr02bCG1190 [Ipomoea batatas]GMC62161.1 hypothetical protein Iba_chr02cCG1230 [Ipomoea batatas]